MSTQPPRLLVTGATGQLGRLVVEGLLERTSPDRIVAAVRDPKKAVDLSARGVDVRAADYGRPQTLDAAFAGVDRLLLISSSERGSRRLDQHRNVIDVAKRAGVKLIGYTSLLHADATPLGLAADHVATEAMLRSAGVPFVVLRNGWYTENHTMGLPAAVAHGAVLGSARDGRFSSAARADYAAAAVAVLTADGHAGKVYELAGDEAYTLPQFAAEVAKASGKPVVYRDMPEAAYEAALVGFGLPEPLAAMLADSDVGASKGGLFDDGKQLSRLIGRPTTPWSHAVAVAVAAGR